MEVEKHLAPQDTVVCYVTVGVPVASSGQRAAQREAAAEVTAPETRADTDPVTWTETPKNGSMLSLHLWVQGDMSKQIFVYIHNYLEKKSILTVHSPF